jgi:hypothetical protein
VWIDIPGPATLLQSCTTQRDEGMIFSKNIAFCNRTQLFN